MKRGDSLQRIQDRYIRRGYTGARLQRALAKDQTYLRLRKNRRKNVALSLPALSGVEASKGDTTPGERRRYVLSTDQDYDILALCKSLERKRLTQSDRTLVKLIKSQLADEWRPPLLAALRTLARRYR